ncbi:MAG: hypothetical protein ACLGSD_07805 [Acidobacteriota bacterium]
MRQMPRWAVFAVVCAVMVAPVASRAVSCTTQSEMTPADRDALARAGQQFALAVQQQDLGALQSALLPAVSADWDSIRDAVQQGGPLVKGGTVQLRSLYMLDATSQTAPADTQFFCSNASASLTVTITMRQLPPGRYAVVLADAAGAQFAGQIGFVLGWDANTWKVGGVFVRPGALGGHDGVWYWEQARQLAAHNAPWAAYYSYAVARYLLLPVDFLSSPNLQKLDQEQSEIKNPPTQAFPITVTAGDRSWKVNGIHFDPALHEPDLGVTYVSAGVTDPAAQRTEAITVLGAVLKAHPALRQSFHGMWAYASVNGHIMPVMELPMAQIP